MNRNAGKVVGAEFLECLPVPACMVNREGNVVYANSLIKNVFAYDDIVDGNFFALTGNKLENLEEANAADDASKDSKDAKIADLEDRLKRQIAEFDNFRKRTEKEKSAMFDMGARHIIEAILPTIDNFERGLKTVPEDKEAKAFYDGMEMVYKQMLKVLSDVGVTAIDCLDKEFDLNLHNAVMHVEDEAYGNNIIIEEFQKGYKYKDTVIRHSMVKVAN